MSSFNPANLIPYGLMLMLLLSANLVQANCNQFTDAMPRLQQEVESFEKSSQFLDGLLKGSIDVDALPSGKQFISLFKVPLDNSAKVASAIQLIETQLDNLSKPLAKTDSIVACSKQGTDWLFLSNRHRLVEAKLLEARLVFLKMPALKRALLLRELSLWGKVETITEELSLQQQMFEKNEAVLLELDYLADWTKRYQASFLSWFQVYMSQGVEFDRVDQVWLSTLSLVRPEDELIDSERLAKSVPPVAEWLYALNEARSSLFKDVSRWRHQALLSHGWLSFFAQLSSPANFLDGLYQEVVSAPKNFLDNLSRPFIKEYKLADKEDRLLTLLLAWTSQVLGLLLMAFILIKMASAATSWLAGLQQALIARVNGASLHSVVSGFFWVVKPNASWLFILFSANSIVLLFHENWKILSLIAPLGTIYAVFRGLKVLTEWVLSRTYTRSDIFLSSQAAEQLVHDSERIAWVALGCLLFWWLAYGAGGGYSIYLISLVDVVILWCACLWLLSRYKGPVDKLVERVLRTKISSAQAEVSFFLKLMLRVAWPLVFIFVHLVDILLSLHQKLMVFDVYRSLSVKLLRVRLESRSEEVLEEDEAEPDQNYTDWMLREVVDDTLFDVGDLSGLLEPLKKWHADKTDENVTVVVGESGSGKTTLIRRLPSIWEHTPVKLLMVSEKLTEPQDFYLQLTELLGIDLISDAGGLVKQEKDLEPQVVVIDAAHNLFMAEVGFFNAYRALMECMNAHLDNIYWVVVMNAPSWTYLSNVFSRQQRVSNIFKMPRWSPMDIRKLILSRHKGGKRRLKYNNLLLSAAASSESSSIRAADSRVFNILWEQSGGNPLAAIELWLNAVKVKGRIAEVGVPERPSANLLNGMKDDLYFVYTAIVLHASLSTEEIMQVTHFSESMVRHAVKQGINMGMIVRDEHRRYNIDPYWYGSLSSFLHRKNLLWH